jgi:hypothetical protein
MKRFAKSDLSGKRLWSLRDELADCGDFFCSKLLRNLADPEIVLKSTVRPNTLKDPYAIFAGASVPGQSLLLQRGHRTSQEASLSRCGIASVLKSFRSSAQVQTVSARNNNRHISDGVSYSGDAKS